MTELTTSTAVPRSTVAERTITATVPVTDSSKLSDTVALRDCRRRLVVMVRLSNWFRFLTRRKTDRSVAMLPNAERAPETTTTTTTPTSNPTTADGLNAGDTPSQPAGGRRRKSSAFLHVFNKCLNIRSKSTARQQRPVSHPALPTDASNRRLTTSDEPATVAAPVTVHTNPPTGQQEAPVIRDQPQAQPAPQPAPVRLADDISSSSSSSSSSQLHGSLVERTANQSAVYHWLSTLPTDVALVYKERIAMTPRGWYRGAMTRERAQKHLQAKPNGSFLVRDSQSPGCHFTLSFRSAGITLHYRIGCPNGPWQIESYRDWSLVNLIEYAQQLSCDQILCYVKPSSQLQQPFPVRLTHAISNRSEVPSLQHVCRYVIRQHMPELHADECRLDGVLPAKLQEFVREKAFLGTDVGYFET